MTDFIAFASQYGLIIDRPIADGKWHRTRTTDKRKAKRNGSYILLGDRGAVRNWATMQGYAIYRPDKPMAPVDRAAMRRMMLQAAREERERHESAAKIAADMLQRATLVKPKKATKWADGVYTHPYLDRKGFPQAECLVLDGKLLIPMRDLETDKLVGMQTIAEDGTKLFIPGSRAKLAVFRLGRATETWLCEGVATAYSVDAALKALYRQACVLVCFSAGNLVAVASKLKGPAYVVADHDASMTGQRAAEATGLPWVMPAVVNTDANDLHQAAGIKAVRDLLRAAI